MDETDISDLTSCTTDTTPVDTSNTPASGSPSAPSTGWTPAQDLSLFNSALGAALQADTISHSKNLPTSYGKALVPGTSVKNNNFMILLLVVGAFLLMEHK